MMIDSDGNNNDNEKDEEKREEKKEEKKEKKTLVKKKGKGKRKSDFHDISKLFDILFKRSKNAIKVAKTTSTHTKSIIFRKWKNFSKKDSDNNTILFLYLFINLPTSIFFVFPKFTIPSKIINP